MKKQLWYWEKHNVVNYLRTSMDPQVEFTVESLINKITKGHHYYGYTERIISEHLSQLAVDGYLQVRYESVKMSGTYISKRFGSKTISVYKIIHTF